MISYFDLIIVVIILNPIAILIHELGHCMWVKIFRATVTSINIGIGDRVFSIGKLHLNRWYFQGGNFYYNNLNKPTKVRIIFILLGGVLANFIIFCILFIFHFYVSLNRYVYLFAIVNFYNTIFNLLPITVAGMNLDGKQIYNIIKYGKSTLYKESEDEVNKSM